MYDKLYFDDILDKWCAGTSGTADGEGEVNNKYGTTFSDLFWETLTKMKIDKNKFKRILNEYNVSEEELPVILINREVKLTEVPSEDKSKVNSIFTPLALLETTSCCQEVFKLSKRLPKA